jgi:hypothetical protein
LTPAFLNQFLPGGGYCLKMKKIYVRVIVIFMILLVMAACVAGGVIVATVEFSKSLKLLLTIEVVERYDDVQQAYLTKNADVTVWELNKFDNFLDKINDYEAIPKLEFLFYKFIAHALMYRMALENNHAQMIPKHREKMIYYYQLFSDMRTFSPQPGDMDKMVTSVVEKWQEGAENRAGNGN